jgi:predicted 2-oxoglutarate/Fe(II)-dependent dioxygenase YbiX
MTELEGRTIRAVDVTPADIGAHADAIEDIHRGSLDAVVLRQAFPASLRLAILERLAGGELPWQRPNSSGPRADIRVLGNAATPTFNTPGGPAYDRYFEDAAAYGALYDQLLRPAGQADPIEELLARIAGGRPVVRLALPDGRRFAGCTIRSLPEGQRIIVHHDGRHFQLPVYQGVTGELDTSTCLSFVVLLQAPEAGGEVVIHGLTDADQVPRLASFLPDGEAIKARFRSHRVAMDAGDVLVFSAGRYYHHVAPVIGAMPRITLGGFMTLDRDHRRVLYWN